MKDFLLGMVAVSLAVALFVAFSFVFKYTYSESETEVLAQIPTTSLVYSPLESVVIYDSVNENSFTISIADYLTGALLANLDPDCGDEVIKAQTVILYTYILSRRIEAQNLPNEEYHGADISCDVANCLPYMSLPDAELKYADSWNAVKSHLEACIDEVIGTYIAYNYSPIEPAFCRSCGGRTESAIDAIGVEVPYLKSVDSSFEDEIVTTVIYTESELFARLSTRCEGVALYGEPQYWITVGETSADGYVKTARVGTWVDVSGKYLSEILNLPSAKFELVYDTQSCLFTFTVKGEGNLMGFSQSGADKLAKLGYTWQQLLNYYYTDVDIIIP